MIRIYNQNRILKFQTENYAQPVLEIDATAFDMLSLSVPADTPVSEEDYIEVKQGRFVVKEKNYSDGEYELVCLADVDDLEHKVLPNFVHATVTMQTMLDDFLSDTGWTGTCSSAMKRTVTGTNLNALQAVLKAVDTFRFEVRFNTIAKTITVAERLGQDIGAYYDDELNLETLEYQSDSYGFATRIVPVGQNGLGIELVNDGLPYLENKTYYQKTKTVFWTDERYTVVENLKYDAQLKLDDMATPLRSYAAKLIDLVKDRPELEANVLDTIWLKHRASQTRVQQRIVKKKIPLDRPWDVDVTIANKMRDFLTDQDRAINEVRRSYESVTARFDLFEDSIEGEINSIKIDVDGAITEVEQNTSLYSQLSDEIRMAVTNEILQSTLDQATQDIMVNTMTQLTQTAQGWEFLFGQLQVDLTGQIDGTGIRISEIEKWVRIVDGKLILGQSDSEVTLTVRNNRVYFEQGGQEVAYFSNSKLYVYDIEAINSLTIGNFRWVPRSNGNLSLV